MSCEVILPRVDMDMETAKITRWFFDDGAVVNAGDPLFEIETDKAAMEVDASASGTLRLKAGGRVNETIAVGEIVAYILQPGEAAPPGEVAPPGEATPPQAAHDEPCETGPMPTPPAIETISEQNGRPAGTGARATPLARRMARNAGLNIAQLRGSGPRGRVTSLDVKDQLGEALPAPAIGHAKLHIMRGGKRGAAPVVFLHGFGSEAASWRPLWQLLGESAELLAVDLPGHGKSGQDMAATHDAIIEAILQTIRPEGLGAVHLTGHSLGGALAAQIASRQLLDIRSLLLFAPAGLGPEINAPFFLGFLRARQEASLRPWVAKLFANPLLVTDSMIRAILDSNQDPARLEFRRALVDAMFPDATQSALLSLRLSDLPMPARIMWGKSDEIIPHRHALNVPGAIGVHLLDSTGHMPHIEQVALTARIQKELIQAAA